MAITEEGNYNGVITKIEFIEGRFKDSPNVIEVKIMFEIEGLGVDKAYLSLDNYTYCSGKNSHMTYMQKSMESLKALGCEDLSQIQVVLIGKPIGIYSKFNSSGYINNYVSSFAENVLSSQDVMAKLFGNAPVQQAQAPVQQQMPVNNQPTNQFTQPTNTQPQEFAPQQAVQPPASDPFAVGTF